MLFTITILAVQYLALGVELTNIHRVLVFQQRYLLKSYIIFNIDKRKHAADEFEKDFTNIVIWTSCFFIIWYLPYIFWRAGCSSEYAEDKAVFESLNLR